MMTIVMVIMLAMMIVVVLIVLLMNGGDDGGGGHNDNGDNVSCNDICSGGGDSKVDEKYNDIDEDDDRPILASSLVC